MNVAMTLRREDEIFRDFPIGFSSLSQASVDDAPTYVEQLLSNAPTSQSFKVPLLYLGVEGRRFLPEKPIGVQVTQDGAWFFAENASLNVIGTGKSAEEAVLDLQHHIVHFWEHYRAIQDTQVIGEAVRLKRLFSNLLVELHN